MNQPLLERIDQSIEAIYRQLGHTRVILLHPESQYRSLIIARIMQKPQLPVYYFAFSTNQTTVPAFISEFSRSIALQAPSFGKRLLTSNPDHEGTAAEISILLTTLIGELEQLEQEPYVLILDEFDWIEPSSDLNAFMEQLLLQVPEHCTILINARSIPRLPWLMLIASGKTIILKDGAIQGFTYPTRLCEPHDSFSIEAQSFGSGAIAISGRIVNQWEGHLPRLLLFLLLEYPLIRRSEICSILWPNLPEEQAVNIFHVTKRRLHKALGQDVLSHRQLYYALSKSEDIRYDAACFVEALTRARLAQSAEEEISAWEQAISLYRGHFLAGYADTWIIQRRKVFQSAFVHAVLRLADRHMKNHQVEKALQVLLPAAQITHAISLHEQIVRAYLSDGRGAEAASYLNSLEQRQDIYHELLWLLRDVNQLC